MSDEEESKRWQIIETGDSKLATDLVSGGWRLLRPKFVLGRPPQEAEK